jgi:hypothetical protein
VFKEKLVYLTFGWPTACQKLPETRYLVRLVRLPELPAETHGFGPFLFPQYHRLRIPMKTPSRFFYFVAIFCLLLALVGAFLAGYYHSRNDSLAKLGQELGFWGAVLAVFAAAIHKKQKGNPASPR